MAFAVIGARLAQGLTIRWSPALSLAVLWVSAPLITFIEGYILTKCLDLVPQFVDSGSTRVIRRSLVLIGGAASLVMGENYVSNATAAFLTTGIPGDLLTGTLGGIGIASGVLTWSSPLLERIAFDVVKVDMAMATDSQLVQGLVVPATVLAGYFTSMNQALIGAMAGAGFARGRETLDQRVAGAVPRGWVVGPLAGMILEFSSCWFLQRI